MDTCAKLKSKIRGESYQVSGAGRDMRKFNCGQAGLVSVDVLCLAPVVLQTTTFGCMCAKVACTIALVSPFRCCCCLHLLLVFANAV